MISLVALLLCAAAPNPPNPVWIVAHRGAHAVTPENTIAAFEAAADFGADYMETDVRPARDGELVLMHDDNVDRTTDGHGAVAGLTLAQIRSLGARGQRVPSFREALLWARGRGVRIDVDHKAGAVEDVARAIRDTGMTGRVVIESSREHLRRFVELLPGVDTMPKVESVAEIPALCRELRTTVIRLSLAQLAEAGAAEAVRGCGARVSVTILGKDDTGENMRRVISQGAQLIETDRPDVLARVRREMGAVPSPFDFLRRLAPVPDAHNCYPEAGRWAGRIERALAVGYPIGIEQDLAWFADPATGKGRVVVSHTARTTGSEPELRGHFFERVRPLVEKALAENRKSEWPLIVVHFDFKDNQRPLLEAVYELLGEYRDWITTAVNDPGRVTPFDSKPLLVLTEDSDAQEEVFFRERPVGSRLLLFGSAHTAEVKADNKLERDRLEATVAPSALLRETPTAYRRWWNLSWHKVEEGGQRFAGQWTPVKAARLQSLVQYAHQQGFWIRFYTLDGFGEEENRGWNAEYNFGSRAAVETRWKAAVDAGADLIAGDQYEELAGFLRANRR